MRKVKGCQGCAAQEAGFWALEVVQTSGKARAARTSKQMVSLLEALGDSAMVRELLDLAAKHKETVLQCTRKPIQKRLLQKLADHDLNDYEKSEREGRPEPVVTTTRILNAGFEMLEEPYLHQKVSQIVESQLSKLRLGSFPIADSAFAYG
eukprot:7387303-Prymnesium_polylepis.1